MELECPGGTQFWGEEVDLRGDAEAGRTDWGSPVGEGGPSALRALGWLVDTCALYLAVFPCEKGGL